MLGGSPYISLALMRLQRGVCVCCWTVGIALVVQVLAWCMTTFTESRHATLIATVATGEVVTTPPIDATAVVVAAQQSQKSWVGQNNKAANPNRAYSSLEPMMGMLSTISLAAGTMATIALLPLLLTGVLLGVSGVVMGVEDTIASFIWFCAIGILILPAGHLIGLPWHEGALTSYAFMTRQVEATLTGSSWGGLIFYARFLMLPLACAASIAVIGVRFSNGVRAGIIPSNLRLDPILEREAAGVKPSSLHGGRAGQAMRTAGVVATIEQDDRPMTQAVAGSAPKRLI